LFLKPAFPPLAHASVVLVLVGYARIADNRLLPGRGTQLALFAGLAYVLALLFFALGAVSAFLQLVRVAKFSSASGYRSAR